MVAKERKQHGWGDGNLVRPRAVVVLHRILARHARHAVSPAHALKFTVGANELSEFEPSVRGLFGHDGVGPAEVVEPRHPVDVHAHTDRVSHRFVHGGDDHGAGIDVRVTRHNPVADHQSAAGAVQGCNHGRIGRAVALNANKGLDRRLSDDFVVVLPHPILLAGHVRPGKKTKQQGVVVGVLRGHKGRMLGRRPHALQAELRHTIMQKLEREEGHDVLAVTHQEAPVIGERRHHGGLDLVNRCHRFEGFCMVRMHGHRHPLLGFRDEDLPRGQSDLLEGRSREVDLNASGLLRHFTDGGRNPACAVVGDAGD